MGASAGYTIKVSDCVVDKVSSVFGGDITFSKSKGSVVATIRTDIKATATLLADSYYHTSGEIEQVALNIVSVNLDLDIGNGHNSEILTSEAIEKYETEFGTAPASTTALILSSLPMFPGLIRILSAPFSIAAIASL